MISGIIISEYLTIENSNPERKIMQNDLNDDKEKQTEEIFQYYSSLTDRGSQENIVAMLRELQEVNGYIGPALKEMASAAAGVKPAVIQVILKRYPSLKPAPFFHEIVVCTGRSCFGKGRGELLQELRKRLDIRKNGITADGRVCVRTRNCLKNCKAAPNAMVDGVLYSGITVDEIIKIVKDCG